MADYKICRPPQTIAILGLGSCIGVVFYDTLSKWCSMAHIMLPDSKVINGSENRYKFVDTCLQDMYDELLEVNGMSDTLIAKMVGGARMFAFSSKSEHLNIGSRNIKAAKLFLDEKGIPLVSEDTGKTFGRTIEFNPATGELVVKTVGVGITII